MFVNICGPVIADTTYCENELVARDVAISLPEVVPMTADLNMMGTFSMPIWQLLEHMESSITKIGVDKGLRAMLKPEMKHFEHRWVQTVTDENGVTKNVGCKAFLRGIPNKLPGVNLEVGSATEAPCTIALVRYSLYVDGEEMFLIDRLAGIVRIAGKDYTGNIESML